MDMVTIYAKIGAPASRALDSLGLKTVEELARFSRAGLAALHGVGPKALRIIEAELASMGLGLAGAEKRKGLGEIGQIAVAVSDVGKALAFYRDVLGLRFLFEAGPNLAFLAAGPVRVMLTTPQGAGRAGANSILYFKVEGIEAAYADLTARGAVGDSPPALTARLPDHDLWIGSLRDPDGNLVCLMEEKRG